MGRDGGRPAGERGRANRHGPLPGADGPPVAAAAGRGQQPGLYPALRRDYAPARDARGAGGHSPGLGQWRLRIVTAFTLGHSRTLLLGALGWVHLPSQPVEVLIAGASLVSAVHAWRPVFPGREGWVAAGFGLVHGLAFASKLAGLHLDAGRLGLSILGFNLGIELMQLFVLALTVPWLLLLSRPPTRPCARPARRWPAWPRWPRWPSASAASPMR
ncbi:MAG: HupE/UreJ family protein [Hymenobacter sp.]|nr:MAG: HupE/UreJ family protein [Hymenobacter sp.]